MEEKENLEIEESTKIDENVKHESTSNEVEENSLENKTSENEENSLASNEENENQKEQEITHTASSEPDGEPNGDTGDEPENKSKEIIIDNTQDLPQTPSTPLTRNAKIKEPMDKKKKIIIVAIVVAAIIAIFSAIFFPTFFYYREKVMIASAENFKETGSAKKYYVLKQDVTTKDLTLTTGYSLDLHKHNLTVDGTLTLSPTTKGTMMIGSIKKGSFTSSGILYANNLVVDSETSSFNFVSPIVVKNTLTILNAKDVIINNATITGGAFIKAEDVYLNGKIENSTTIEIECNNLYINNSISSDTIKIKGNTNVIVNQVGKIHKLELEDTVNATLRGTIDSVMGGNVVVMENGYNCSSFRDVKTLAMYQAYNVENLDIKDCDKVIYLDTLQAPVDAMIVEEDGKFIVKIAYVEYATKYLVKVEGPGKDNFKEYEVENSSNPSVEITNFLKSNDQAVLYKISVKSLGNYSIEKLVETSTKDGDTLYLDSTQTKVVEYSYTLQLKTPSVEVRYEREDSKVYLDIPNVDYADYFLIIVDGEKIEYEINKDKTKQTVDITKYIDELGYHSIRVQAKSKSTQILPSKEIMTSYKTTTQLNQGEEIDLSVVRKDNGETTTLTISFEKVDNAKIYVLDIDGNIVRLSNVSTYEYECSIEEIPAYVEIYADGYNFYLESKHKKIEQIDFDNQTN